MFISLIKKQNVVSVLQIFHWKTPVNA
jgi:hypothetical protein